MPQVPQPPYPYKHQHPLQVRFNDIDLLGHVNNSIYFQYMDLGKVEYIADVLGEDFNFHRESLVIVNVNCEFYHITLFGEPLIVLTRVDSIGTHSITLEQRVVNADSHEVKTIARTVMVGFNMKTESKMRIPVHWRAKISTFEGRPL